MSWIKLDSSTPDKPEIHAMADMLGIAPEHVLGGLIRVWIWADQQTENGDAISVTRALANRVSMVTRFSDAMVKVGWLVEKNGVLSFPNFDRHNGETAKKRAQNAKRNARFRANAPVTQTASPDKSKRREEKSPYREPRTHESTHTQDGEKTPEPSAVHQAPPTVEIVVNAGQMMMIPEAFCREWHETLTAQGWMDNNGRPCAFRWRNLLKRYWETEKATPPSAGRRGDGFSIGQKHHQDDPLVIDGRGAKL